MRSTVTRYFYAVGLAIILLPVLYAITYGIITHGEYFEMLKVSR